MLVTVLTIIFVLISLLLVVLVLIQPHEGEGFASAFSGSSANTFFGTKALSYAWKMTIVLAGLFLVLALVINKLPHEQSFNRGSTSVVETPPADGGGAPADAVPPAPAPAD